MDVNEGGTRDGAGSGTGHETASGVRHSVAAGRAEEGTRDGTAGGARGGTGHELTAGGVVPGWWPYAREFPGWQVWRGVDRLYYAALGDTSPPVRVRGEDPVDLRDQIRAHLLRPAP